MAKHESMEMKKEEREKKEERHEKRAEGGKAGHHMTHGGHRSVSDGHEMDREGPMSGMGHKRHARGGKAEDGDGEGKESQHDEKGQEYNAQGSNEMKEAEEDKADFKRGGKMHKKRRAGGHAEGKMAEHRLDRRPRRAAGGATHSPYSSASKMDKPMGGSPAERGMEGQKIPEEKTD